LPEPTEIPAPSEPPSRVEPEWRDIPHERIPPLDYLGFDLDLLLDVRRLSKGLKKSGQRKIQPGFERPTESSARCCRAPAWSSDAIFYPPYVTFAR